MTIWDDIRQKALMKYQWGKVIAVTGRLGSGKTEFLLNLASAFKTIDEDVTVVDVDITNPYFCVREIAAKLQKALPNQDLRVALDLRNEKITYKIREHSLQKLPYILVAGDKEKAAGAVAVRARGNRDLGVMSVDAFIELIAKDIADKA